MKGFLKTDNKKMKEKYQKDKRLEEQREKVPGITV